MHRFLTISAGAFLVWSSNASAQSVTRQQAIESAVTRGGRLAAAFADTAAAQARIATARALQNPSLNASYSKSTPQLHFTVDLPLDLPGVRSARIQSAESFARGASYRLRYERAAIELAADTAYTRVLAARARARLTQRNALVADTLVQMTVARRSAGDASELEVEMARVNAGQQHNLAIADSVELAGALVDLQTAMGLTSITPGLQVADSIVLPDTATPPMPPGTPLLVAAAMEGISSARSALIVERRGAIGSPSLMGGFETRDPSGSEKGILPTFGFTIPLPLFNRNQAGIATARADLRKAQADLAVAQIEYASQLATTRRERSAAYARATRDLTLLAAANRVAQMSITAYKAGAMALPNVFEAQRNARDILRQYIDDLSAAWTADATLRLLTLTTAQ
jgi:Outer membrane protein